MISQVRQAGLGLSWARQGHSRRRHCSSCGLCILKDVMAKSMWYDCQPWSPVSSSKLILISASVLKQELGSCIGLTRSRKGQSLQPRTDFAHLPPDAPSCCTRALDVEMHCCFSAIPSKKCPIA
ncbi:uncharacterized protein LOC120509988 isoform X7 [Passer montanus]|uniref:uncharacterized protein LOC120509988 isoform X7 n=1 Tax=Passer montanus TaxID=9160 RepID=UPI00196050B8|nr:uncharacterized protein LOC120509988 isoform X7 [Passer montanus]XP_039581252.1 uncharacterized protein LOC120509988 isoform X7 [Passer montanus]